MSAALVILGAMVSIVGIWLIYQPAAIVAAGLLISGIGIVWAFGKREE